MVSAEELTVLGAPSLSLNMSRALGHQILSRYGGTLLIF
jgi:hypothetical protein